MSHTNSADGASACQKLADLATSIATQNPTLTPKEFILTLGEQAAGIRRGPWGFLDLLRGGRNALPGGGFRPEFDDGSGGQVRHFGGIAVSCIWFGPKMTVWLSETVRRDAANSPDGRLTLAAVEFCHRLLEGELPIAAAGEWLRDHLCRPEN